MLAFHYVLTWKPSTDLRGGELDLSRDKGLLLGTLKTQDACIVWDGLVSMMVDSAG